MSPREPDKPVTAPSDAPAPVSLFPVPAPNWKAQMAASASARRAHGDAFEYDGQAHQFFSYILTPRDGAWAFKPNSKAGITSTLYFLFHLEFGVPLTVTLADEDPATDRAGHRLAEARVFSTLAARSRGDSALEVLNGALRVTSVRHPLDRATSSFRFLCRAETLGIERFSRERIRMNARVGFDWSRHPGTAGGFERFLEFLRLEFAECGAQSADSHIRPQVFNIRPAIFRPHVVGRMERMDAFYREIALRLDRPMPDDFDPSTRRNAHDGGASTAAFSPSRAARRAVAEIFAEDYEAFDYDP